MQKVRLDQYLCVVVMSVTALLNGSWVAPTRAEVTPTVQLVKSAPIPVFKVSPLSQETNKPEPISPPVVAEQLGKTFLQNLTAEAVYVMDVESGAPLLTEQADQLRYPASTTKLLTALVAAKTFDVNFELQVQEEAFAQGTTMGLELGQRISVKNLLYGLLMQSGNDAAFMFANNYPDGGYQGFVDRMNELAHELHLDQTHFTNPSGLDQDTHQTTARDLAILSQEIMKDELLSSIVGTKVYILATSAGETTKQLTNTNALLGVEPGVIGVKTGTTEQAGEVLITQVERNGHQVVIVVMGSDDRYADTRQIIDWIFSNYAWVEVVSSQ